MVKRTDVNRRGKPQDWTDEQLREMALEVKYNNQTKQLTPSFLQKETGVGRNTWSRRMKNYISELNKPMSSHISINEDNETILPNFHLVFEKYGNNTTLLKNELINIENLMYELYNELNVYRKKEQNFIKAKTEIQALKDEVLKHKKRAEHYEQLYNTITVSSMFPHLKNEKRSKVYELGIKESLLDFNLDRDKNLNLQDLSAHFPDVSDENCLKNERDHAHLKKEKNMQTLLNKFDI